MNLRQVVDQQDQLVAKDARFQHSVQEAKFVGIMLVHVVPLVVGHRTRQSLEKVSIVFQVIIGAFKIFNHFADNDDKNFAFSQKQLQLLENAAKRPKYQSFVLGFALLPMLWQDKEKESPLVQNMIPLSRDAFKQLSTVSKVT